MCCWTNVQVATVRGRQR